MLQEVGRMSARAALMGRGTGTLAVSKRQAQSMLIPERDLRVVQQLSFCEEPLLLLPVMTLKHGVKLLIIEAVHGERICPLTEELPKIVAATEMNAKALKVSIISVRNGVHNETEFTHCHLSLGGCCSLYKFENFEEKSGRFETGFWSSTNLINQHIIYHCKRNFGFHLSLPL